MDELEHSSVSLEAEKHLAGCLLVSPLKTLADIRGKVSASDFSDILCRNVYTAVLWLLDNGAACDPVLVQAHIQNAGGRADSAQLAELMNAFASTASAARHAEIVHEAAVQRRAAAVGYKLASGEFTIGKAVAELQQIQDGAGSDLLLPSEMVQAFADYVDAVAAGEEALFLPTGYNALDDVLGGGLVEGGLITVAARPGTGKTTVGLNIAERVAAAGNAVLYISLEMSKEQLLARRVGIISGLPFGKILRGKLTDKDWPRFVEAGERMSREPFFIVDKPCGVDEVERHIRSCPEVSAVVIDHIGLLTNERGGSRYEFVTATTHRLKQIALATGVPIIALCQLNRACEGREDKRPTMADLRDSGAVEEDSDVVALLFREGVYLPDAEKPKPWEAQPLDIIVDKNRHGMTGTVNLNFCGINARVLEDK